MQTEHTAPPILEPPVLDMTLDGRFVQPARQRGRWPGNIPLHWPMLLGASVAGVAMIAVLSMVLLALLPLALAGLAVALLTGRARFIRMRRGI